MQKQHLILLVLYILVFDGVVSHRNQKTEEKLPFMFPEKIIYGEVLSIFRPLFLLNIKSIKKYI